MEKICDDSMHIADLLFKLRTVEISSNPFTDAKVILLPAEYIMSECSLMSDGVLLRHVTWRAKLFVDFFMHNKYGDTPLEVGIPLLRRHYKCMQNFISSRASQSSGVTSIPSNAIAHTFASGLAVTMDSCAPWCASQA